MIQFECSQCRMKFKVKPEYAGHVKAAITEGLRRRAS